MHEAEARMQSRGHHCAGDSGAQHGIAVVEKSVDSTAVLVAAKLSCRTTSANSGARLPPLHCPDRPTEPCATADRIRCAAPRRPASRLGPESSRARFAPTAAFSGEGLPPPDRASVPFERDVHRRATRSRPACGWRRTARRARLGSKFDQRIVRIGQAVRIGDDRRDVVYRDPADFVASSFTTRNPR